jgi:hypothetical protein
MEKLHHICEVCGRDEILCPDEAFDAGWDYPPRMGHFGVISSRLCPGCPTPETVWWVLAMEGRSAEALTDRQRIAVERMLAEPESLMVTEGEAV